MSNSPYDDMQRPGLDLVAIAHWNTKNQLARAAYHRDLRPCWQCGVLTVKPTCGACVQRKKRAKEKGQ